MQKQKSQPDFTPPSFTKDEEALQLAWPFIERCVAIGLNLHSETDREAGLKPHASCATTDNSWEDLNTLLPKIHQGRGHREYLTKQNIDNLPSLNKITFSDIFEQYESCRHILTRKQWHAVCLYYRDGKTEEEIAKETDKARSSVSGLLVRAKRRLQEHNKQMRHEKFEYLREKDCD